ncbi:MAG: aminoacyl-tRNA hydrolase [Planctomycetota bacterium]|jgi:PTH1 family peptidyl-tRNA hydrolase
MRIVAGLGNPGARYAKTRHNLGFWVVDQLAREAGAAFGSGPFPALVARTDLGGERVVLVKPQTYMNRSGEAVGPLVRWYKVETDSLLVVCDDLDLPAGRIRIRRGGSAGGHKGLGSILADFGTDRIPRLRMGVDRPQGAAESWVLAPLGAEEEAGFQETVGTAAAAVMTWVQEGIEACMARFNG